MGEWSSRAWILVIVAGLIVCAAVAASAMYLVISSGATRPIDNMFGDQHLKTTVALVELHKTRYGRYPDALSDLKFIGEWDRIALNSVSYCASEDNNSYFVEVRRGWIGTPRLNEPPQFWQGTGFRQDVGPCRRGAFGLFAAAPAQTGYVISGRVEDPHNLRPEEAILMLGTEKDGGFTSIPVPLRRDGSFVTAPLKPATYVLEVVRTPHSPTKPATVVGFSIVRVTDADVAGVTVTVRPDFAIQGRFRMESDNAAPWPPHISVSAYLALDSAPLLTGTVADGAAGGRFVLRNAFGPRVLRSGYTLPPGHKWWESRVLLDGVDITNVPTDFSTKADGQLEVVFTQHPAVLAATAIDGQGRPVTGAWVVVFASDRTLWQQWAKTTHAEQTVRNGAARMALAAGSYLVRALPSTAFSSRAVALRSIERLAPQATRVELRPRATTSLSLRIDDR